MAQIKILESIQPETPEEGNLSIFAENNALYQVNSDGHTTPLSNGQSNYYTKTSAFQVSLNDAGCIFNCSADVYLPPTGKKGFHVVIINTTSSPITLYPYSNATINGEVSITVQANSGVTVVSDGTNWFGLSKYSNLESEMPATLLAVAEKTSLDTTDKLFVIDSADSNTLKSTPYSAIQTTITTDEFLADGTAGPYTLTASPIADDYAFVVVGGVPQAPSAYSITGTEITFSEVIANGIEVFVRTISVGT